MTRIKDERFEELISEGEVGVIKSNLLKVLERDPWNIDALRRMARVSKEIEEQIYHLEILRAHPEEGESLRELLMFESSLHRESSDLSLENLEYRLERIVRLIGIEGLKKNLDIFSRLLKIHTRRTHTRLGLRVMHFQVNFRCFRTNSTRFFF